MALSNAIRNFIIEARDGVLRGASLSRRQLDDMMAALANWMESRDKKFWLTATNPGAGVLSASVKLAVYDADFVQNPFNQTSLCRVTITGGTAAGKLINGVAGPVDITMVDGQALLTVSATSTGTLILGLSNPSPAGLDVTSTATVTFS